MKRCLNELSPLPGVFYPPPLCRVVSRLSGVPGVLAFFITVYRPRWVAGFGIAPAKGPEPALTGYTRFCARDFLSRSNFTLVRVGGASHLGGLTLALYRNYHNIRGNLK